MTVLEYILVIILVSNTGITVSEQERYEHLYECFLDRELLVERMPQPVINYQVLCVHTDKEMDYI
jgi:hypothetical protein